MKLNRLYWKNLRTYIILMLLVGSLMLPMLAEAEINSTGTYFEVTHPVYGTGNIVSAVSTNITIDIDIVDAPDNDTRAWGLKLVWNNMTLNITRVQEGPFLKSVNPNTTFVFEPLDLAQRGAPGRAGGSIGISCTIRGDPDTLAGGSGRLCNVTFHVLDCGRSPLDLEVTKLVNRAGVGKEYPNNDGFFACESVHDVRIIDVAVNDTQPQQGDPVNITVTVHNDGNFPENLTIVIIYHIPDWVPFVGCTWIIIVQNLNVSNLLPCNNATVSHTWDTTAVAGEVYEIVANATITTPGVTDADPHDNQYIGPEVHVVSLHDMKITDVSVLTPKVSKDVVMNFTGWNRALGQIEPIDAIESCGWYQVNLTAAMDGLYGTAPKPSSWWHVLICEPVAGVPGSEYRLYSSDFHVDISFPNGTFHIDQVLPVDPYPAVPSARWAVAEMVGKVSVTVKNEGRVPETATVYVFAEDEEEQMVFTNATGYPREIMPSLNYSVLDHTPTTTMTFASGVKMTFTNATQDAYGRRCINWLAPCGTYLVVDGQLPANDTWWHTTWPDAIASIQFHVDWSNATYNTFHIDNVTHPLVPITPYPIDLRATPMVTIEAQLKINLIAPCMTYVVEEPECFVPLPCTWWHIIFPEPLYSITFHVDWSNPLNKTFHIDIVEPYPIPIPPPGVPFIMAQQIMWVPEPSSWWHIIGPEEAEELISKEFHVDWSDPLTNQFHIDFVWPDPYPEPIPYPGYVVAEREIVIDTPQIVTLGVNETVTLYFDWSLCAGLRCGEYTIKALVFPVEDEEPKNWLDNKVTDDTIEVQYYDVEIVDLQILTKCYPGGFHPIVVPEITLENIGCNDGKVVIYYLATPDFVEGHEIIFGIGIIGPIHPGDGPMTFRGCSPRGGWHTKMAAIAPPYNSPTPCTNYWIVAKAVPAPGYRDDDMTNNVYTYPPPPTVICNTGWHLPIVEHDVRCCGIEVYKPDCCNPSWGKQLNPLLVDVNVCNDGQMYTENVNVTLSYIDPSITFNFTGPAGAPITTLAPCQTYETCEPYCFVPGNDTWWHIKWPEEVRSIEFHIDVSYANHTFHIDEVLVSGESTQVVLPTPVPKIMAEKEIFLCSRVVSVDPGTCKVVTFRVPMDDFENCSYYAFYFVSRCILLDATDEDPCDNKCMAYGGFHADIIDHDVWCCEITPWIHCTSPPFTCTGREIPLWAYAGNTVKVNVTVCNQGNFPESVMVELFYIDKARSMNFSGPLGPIEAIEPCTDYYISTSSVPVLPLTWWHIELPGRLEGIEFYIDSVGADTFHIGQVKPFNVTLTAPYPAWAVAYQMVLIGTNPVVIPARVDPCDPGPCVTTTFTWATAGLTACRDYDLVAHCQIELPTVDEDPCDNKCVLPFSLRLMGDDNNNGEVKIDDVGTTCSVYASGPTCDTRLYRYESDYDASCCVTILDVGTVCACFAAGYKCPP